MNKKLLIVFVIGVIAYVVWKKMNEENEETGDTSTTPPSASDIKRMKKTRSGADTMGSTQYKANLTNLGNATVNTSTQSRK